MWPFSGVQEGAPNDNDSCDGSDNHPRMDRRTEPTWRPGEAGSKPLFNDDKKTHNDPDRGKEHEGTSSDEAGEEIVYGRHFPRP